MINENVIRELLEDLKPKKVKKMWKKDKDNLYVVETCIPIIIETYYDVLWTKQFQQYRNKFNEIILNPYFLKSVKRILKGDGMISKEDIEPLSFIILAELDTARKQVQEEIKRENERSISEEEKKSNMMFINEQFEDLCSLSFEITEKINSKKIKKLVNQGCNPSKANELASYIVNSNVLTERNVFKFSRLMFANIRNMYEATSTYSDDKSTFVNNIGLPLEVPEGIEKLMEKFTLKEANKNIYFNMILAGSLDVKDKYYEKLPPASKAFYNALTNYYLQCLNSDLFDKSDRIKLFKEVMKRRVDNNKNGYESQRRITFSALKDLKNEDGSLRYKKIVKAWEEFSNK